MIKKKPFKRMTENEYLAIKTRLKQAVPAQVIRETGRASGTISAINRSESYEHYKELCRRNWAGYVGASNPQLTKTTGEVEVTNKESQVRLTNGHLKLSKKEIAIREVELLDKLFSQLREQITVSAIAIAEYRAEEAVNKVNTLLEEKDKELVEYHKIMEEAKNDNLLTNLKRKFLMD